MAKGEKFHKRYGTAKSHQARTVAAKIEAQRLADEREHERETRIVTIQREVERLTGNA